MVRRARRVALGLAIAWTAGIAAAQEQGQAQAQQGVSRGAGAAWRPSQAAGGVNGGPLVNPLANPFANPALNPYLNPAMTRYPVDRSDMLLYFMAAQQARGGLGAGARGGAGDGMMTPPAGRVAPSRPLPNSPVPGRFDDNPSFNDGQGRLAGRYPAYGMRMSRSDGGAVTPGGAPAPNSRTGRYFNRHPSRKATNGR